jgi:hypothetical protein
VAGPPSTEPHIVAKKKPLKSIEPEPWKSPLSGLDLAAITCETRKRGRELRELVFAELGVNLDSDLALAEFLGWAPEQYCSATDRTIMAYIEQRIRREQQQRTLALARATASPPWDEIELEKAPQQTRLMLRLAWKHNLKVPFNIAVRHVWENCAPRKDALNQALLRINSFLSQYGLVMRLAEKHLLILPLTTKQRN